MGALTPGQTPPALTLDQALALARQNRPAIQAAQLRLTEARLQRKSLVAPQPLRLDLQATSNRELLGNDDDIALSQPIDLFGRRTANRALGDAQIRLAEATYRQTVADVQGDVVDRYAETVAAQAFVRSATAQLELAQRLLEATSRRAEGGAIPPVQVKRVGLEVQRARQTLALRQASEAASRRRLAGSLGVPTEQVSVSDFAQVTVVPIDAATLGRQRADLLQLSAQFAIAQANVAVSRVQFRPDFEISARTSAYSYGSNRPSGLRATLAIPVFDYGRSRNDVKAGQAAAQAERKSLDALRKLGIERIVMLTGDNKGVGEAIGKTVGVDEVKAELMPEDKVMTVRELVQRYGKVAMTGDGVNDAPALANATVGIAMGGAGTAVALETADVALMGDDLAKMPFAVGLARQASAIIKQNLYVSLTVVAVLVVATVTGLLRIGPAVFFHEGSTLVVIANSLRLLAYGGKEEPKTA